MGVRALVGELVCPRRAGVIIDVMTDFLIGYVVAAGAGLADGIRVVPG